ncbi:hypothetical protein BLOT_001293 [Blomia tropicalis]|nr:hypothetical protein BLOT_001293 [Blomia tropicalis]
MILRSLLVAVYCSLFAQTIRASCGPNRSSQTIVYGEPRPDGGSVSVTMDVTSDTIPIKVYGNNPFASSIITLGGNRDQNMNTYSGKDYGREYTVFYRLSDAPRISAALV